MSMAYFLASRGGEVVLAEAAMPFCRPWWYTGGDKLTATVIDGESMTDQSQAASVDINLIMRTVERTGIMPVADDSGVYDDVTALQGDFTDMVNASRAVQSVVKEKLDERAKAEEAEAAADREAGRAARAASKAASASKKASSDSEEAGGGGDPRGLCD